MDLGNKIKYIEEQSKNMSKEDLIIVEQEVKKREPKKVLAWLFWLLLGKYGLHSFYLGNNRKGLLYIILNILQLFTYIIGAVLYDNFFGEDVSSTADIFGIVWIVILLLLGITVTVIWVIDAFKLNNQVDNRKHEIEYQEYVKFNANKGMK